MREFLSGSKPAKLLREVIPLAGTRARSRNNGNRLNKYLPFPPSGEHTLRSGLPFILGRKVTILRRYNALTPLNRRLSDYRTYVQVGMSDLAPEARISMAVGNAPVISAFLQSLRRNCTNV